MILLRFKLCTDGKEEKENNDRNKEHRGTLQQTTEIALILQFKHFLIDGYSSHIDKTHPNRKAYNI